MYVFTAICESTYALPLTSSSYSTTGISCAALSHMARREWKKIYFFYGASGNGLKFNQFMRTIDQIVLES